VFPPPQDAGWVVSEFQYFLVTALLKVLEKLPVEQIKCNILSHLAPIDLLNGWGSLLEEGGRKRAIQSNHRKLDLRGLTRCLKC